MAIQWHSVKQWLGLGVVSALGLRLSDAQLAAQHWYVEAVRSARMPQWYADCGVPDTLDGRFEMVLVHVSLVQHALEPHATPHSTAWETQRALSELFFRDMDRSLRELGVSDTGVGRRIKAMAEAYFGRMQAYRAALDAPEALADVLRKNVYGAAVEPTDAQRAQLQAGVTAFLAQLRAYTPEQLVHPEATIAA